MKIRPIFFSLVVAALFSTTASAAAATDTFIGKVQIHNTARLDSQAKKEIAAIAAKIKKIIKSGTVKLVGDMPSAGTPDDYLTKSFFLAKSVEYHLKTLLSNRYQIFLTASNYREIKSGEKNYVSVYLYPFELKAEGLNFISSQLKSESPAEDPTAISTLPTSKAPDDSLLSTPLRVDTDTTGIKSKKERVIIETEDPLKANELVNKAKARAAEKAKRRESQE